MCTESITGQPAPEKTIQRCDELVANARGGGCADLAFACYPPTPDATAVWVLRREPSPGDQEFQITELGAIAGFLPSPVAHPTDVDQNGIMEQLPRDPELKIE
jgi:hypothetical protein